MARRAGLYAELVALSQFLPGPASSQTGFGSRPDARRSARRAGGMDRFTPPSALLMLAFAWRRRDRRMARAAARAFCTGLKLVAVAIVDRPCSAWRGRFAWMFHAQRSLSWRCSCWCSAGDAVRSPRNPAGGAIGLFVLRHAAKRLVWPASPAVAAGLAWAASFSVACGVLPASARNARPSPGNAGMYRGSWPRWSFGRASPCLAVPTSRRVGLVVRLALQGIGAARFRPALRHAARRVCRARPAMAAALASCGHLPAGLLALGTRRIGAATWPAQARRLWRGSTRPWSVCIRRAAPTILRSRACRSGANGGVDERPLRVMTLVAARAPPILVVAACLFGFVAG